jgi:hypothetical protein
MDSRSTERVSGSTGATDPRKDALLSVAAKAAEHIHFTTEPEHHTVHPDG